MRTAVALIFGLMTSFTLLTVHAEENSNHFGPDAYAALGAYRGLVEEHAEGILRDLRIIAETSEARSGKEELYKPLLMRLTENLSTDATTWYALPDGSYFATDKDGMSDEKLKDRHYFPMLMSGKEVLGDLVVSKSTGHRSVIIAVPVVTNGTTVGAVGVSLRVRLLSELVDQHLDLPEDSYFYALERDTRIVLHRYADRMFKTPTDVGDEALGERFKGILNQDKGSLEYTLEDKKISAIFERSPSLNWYFFLAKEMRD